MPSAQTTGATQEHVTFACSNGGPVRSDQRPVNSSSIADKLSSHACRSTWLRQFALSCSGIIIDQSKGAMRAERLSNGMNAETLSEVPAPSLSPGGVPPLNL